MRLNEAAGEAMVQPQVHRSVRDRRRPLLGRVDARSDLVEFWFVRELGRPAGDGLPAPSDPPSPEQASALAEAAARQGIEILGPPPFPH